MDDILTIYLDDAGTFELLSIEQETELLANGSDAARSLLVSHNLRLVVSIAKQFVSSGVDLPDLVQEGNIGLMEAVRDYRPELGRFVHFASDCIRHQIIDSIKYNKARPISLDDLKEDIPVETNLSADVEHNEFISILKDILQTLTLSEAQVIGLFVADKPIPEDDRQTYATAIRKLSHPSRARDLKGLI